MERPKRTKEKSREIRLTSEKKHALIKADQNETRIQVSKRIQCILLKDKGWTHKEIAEHLGKGIGTVSGWIALYTKHGLTGLLAWNYRGKRRKLSEAQMEQIRNRAREAPFAIAQEAVDYVRETFHVGYHPKYMPRLLKKIVSPTKSRA